MYRKGQKGSVTVFLSLTCMLFLSLICTVIESARIQGAKAQTVNILSMANVSLLSEFEKELLERYEIFALDGAYGSEKFQKKKLKTRLETFLLMNTDPKKEESGLGCFDPWNLELTDTEIDKYALLTDGKGEAFYQQAVSFMKQNIGVLAVEELMEYQDSVDEIRNYQRSYEEIQKNNEGALKELEQAKEQKLEALESEAEKIKAENAEVSSGEVLQIAGGDTAMAEAKEKANPLTEIAKLRKKSILELVLQDKELSGKTIAAKGLPSRGILQKGNLSVEKEHTGILANVLFREYLMRYFSNYLEHEEEDVLKYQAEYLLGGKKSDKENLKYVVNRLLLIREGMNYLYCVSDSQISAQANTLAASLTGFLGIPALTAATGQAILLAWAYGESLIDVRTLLNGGRVPLNKSAGDWLLSLENLGHLMEILKSGNNGKQEGMNYSEYLRILLHMGNLSSQKMRALDLIQLDLQKNGGLPDFQVKNCIVAVKTSARWNCGSVFLRLPNQVMRMQGINTDFVQNGSISY